MAPIVCVACALAIAGAAWYFYRRRKRQAGAAAIATTGMAASPKEQQSSRGFSVEEEAKHHLTDAGSLPPQPPAPVAGPLAAPFNVPVAAPQAADTMAAKPPAPVLAALAASTSPLSSQPDTRCGRMWQTQCGAGSVLRQGRAAHAMLHTPRCSSLAATLHCRSYPTTIATSATAALSKDPLMSYIRSQLQSKRSQGDSAMLASGGSGSRSLDLGSFGSQGSVQFDELEILRPCGEGSFGKVRSRGRFTNWKRARPIYMLQAGSCGLAGLTRHTTRHAPPDPAAGIRRHLAPDRCGCQGAAGTYSGSWR